MESYEADAYPDIVFYKTNSSISNISLSLVKLTSWTSCNEEYLYKKINHKLLHTEDVFHEIMRHVENIKYKTATDDDVTLLLLHDHRWYEPKALHFFFEVKNQHYVQIMEMKNRQNQTIYYGECNVCCSSGTLIGSYCGHKSCVACWRRFVTTGLEDRKGFFKCVYTSCPYFLLHSFVLKLEIDMKKYIRNITLEYVNSVKSLRFCPGVDCEYCFQDLSLICKNVTCRCGARFCFKCGGYPHEPCTCVEANQWYELTKNYKHNEIWIKTNTKVCPACKSSIYRAFGCNFISCTCGQNFCYFCSYKWDYRHITHSGCPNTDHVKQKQNAYETREAELTRYYEMFLLHSSLQKRTVEYLNSMINLRYEISKRILVTESDTQFLQTAFYKSLDARSIIKWAEISLLFHKSYSNKYIKYFSLNELKKYMERIGYELSEFIRRVKFIVGTERYFLDCNNTALKEFYIQRDCIMKLTSQAEIFMRQLMYHFDK